MTRRLDPLERGAGEAGQHAFGAALLDPASPLPADLARVNGAAPRKRFAVYRNNVAASLIAALGEAFPTVRKLVGEAFFKAAATVFTRAHPPTTPVMLTYGAAFPTWIADFPPAASAPYLADVARLEWALRRAYHAEDAPALGADAFRSMTAGRAEEAVAALRLRAHPAAGVVASPYPIYDIWARVSGFVDEATAPARDRQTVLVTRPGFDVQATPAPDGAAAFLASLTGESDLETAANAAQLSIEPRLFDFEATLRIFLRNGALRG